MNFQHAQHLATRAAQLARQDDSSAEAVEQLALAVAALAQALDRRFGDLAQDIRNVEHQVRNR